MPSPITLFAYNRPDHLQRTLEALRACPEAKDTDLIVYSDGAKNERAQAGVDGVRALIRDIPGFRSVRVVERASNMGLANSIIQGVGETVAAHGRVIVVEDDLVVSPAFLTYMNRGLDLYADDDGVASIHGYCYPAKEPLPETFFLRGADCWGWGTWARAWAHFRADGTQLLRELKDRKLCRAFDFDGAYGYTQMLRDQIAGCNNSWAIRWHASAFLDEMMTLYPGKSLVHNIGNDGSGTHCGASALFDVRMESIAPDMAHLPITESIAARAIFARYFRRELNTAGIRTRSWLWRKWTWLRQMHTSFRNSLLILKRRLFNNHPALYGMDRKIQKYLPRSNGFFIEAGANDGHTQSNTYFLEKKRGWHGILVEGIPELYEKCKIERPQSTVHQCALVAADFMQPTVTMHYANLMSVVDRSLKTEKAQHAHVGAGIAVQKITNAYSIEVPARTLESILDATPNLPFIDLLSLDVEGYELQVLKGLNLAKYAPHFILVEAKFFEEVHDFLKNHYDLVEQFSHHDYLYKRK